MLGTYYTVEGTDLHVITICCDHIFYYVAVNLAVFKLSNSFLSLFEFLGSLNPASRGWNQVRCIATK